MKILISEAGNTMHSIYSSKVAIKFLHLFGDWAAEQGHDVEYTQEYKLPAEKGKYTTVWNEWQEKMEVRIENVRV